eukprot:jgi/Mesvir1/15812/Mv03368-RA.1
MHARKPWRFTSIFAASCAGTDEELLSAARQVAQNQASLAELPPPFQEYARFHAASLRAATSMGDHANVRYLVYACETGKQCGGLGDRFKGIVTALYLAMVTRRVLLLHQWPIPLSDSLLPMGVDWLTWAECAYSRSNRAILQFSDKKTRQIYSGVSNASTSGGVDEALADALRPDEFITIKARSATWSDILANRHAKLLLQEHDKTGSLSGRARGLLFTWAWRFLFRYSDQLVRSIDDLSSRLGMPHAGSEAPWVGVHIRIGGRGVDYNDNTRYSLSDVGKFAACAAAANEAMAQSTTGTEKPPRLPMYVASDQQAAIKLFIEAMVGRGWNVSSIKYSDQPAFHVERSVVAAAHETDEARRLTVDTLAEMVLLSRMACIVYGRSGFAEVAVDMTRDVRDGRRCERRLERGKHKASW